MTNSVRSARGTAARPAGGRAEILAGVALMAKRRRIPGFRLNTRQAQIDLLALRGKVLAVVEVKRRASLLAALDSVTWDQRERLRCAGAARAAGQPQLAGASVRPGLIALAPGKLPRHIPDAWKGDLLGTP
jgi:putative endonuclease